MGPVADTTQLFAGRFRLEERLGEGGMGTVWRAWDSTSGSEVALKRLRADLVGSPKFAARFQREAALLGRLSHECIAALIAHGWAPDGSPWLAMEYVHGRPLSSVLKGNVSLENLLAIATDIASALTEAHAADIVHRDLKPDNVMVVPVGGGVRAKVLDFGIAVALDDSTRLTTAGKVLGTPSYLAPEQIRGQPTSPATDIWALGVILFRMVTGKMPFKGDLPALMSSIVLDEPDGDVPPAFRTLIARCLAKDPKSRPAAAELESRLREKLVEARLSPERPAGAAGNDLPTVLFSQDDVMDGTRAVVAARTAEAAPAPPPTPPRSATGEIRPGTTITGKYRVLDVIAEGGHGVVFRAQNVATGGLVALKSLRSTSVADPQLSERLRREVRTLARLSHPNTVRVYDIGETDGGDAFVVMELLHGETLASRLARRPRLTTAHALRITEQILGALEEAHGLGVIHRDLKPQNVVLIGSREGGEPVVKLIDFGIARTDDASRLTQDGVAMGTPAYMSPEQIAPKPGWKIGPPTDFYALGVLLYEMVSGQPPFRADSAMALLYQHLSSSPPPLRTHDGVGVPPDLERAVRALLEKAPGDRPQSAADVRALLQFPASEGPAGMAHPRSPRGRRWAVAAAVGASVSIALWRPWRSDSSPPSAASPGDVEPARAAVSVPSEPLEAHPLIAEDSARPRRDVDSGPIAASPEPVRAGPSPSGSPSPHADSAAATTATPTLSPPPAASPVEPPPVMASPPTATTLNAPPARPDVKPPRPKGPAPRRRISGGGID